MTNTRTPEIGRPTLGSSIRGARLGYRWLPPLGCYLRVTDTDDGFVLDLAPAGAIPGRPQRDRYRQWWAGPTDLVADLVDLARLVLGPHARRVRRRIVLTFTDDGEPVGCEVDP